MGLKYKLNLLSTLKELWTSVSSRSITIHFLCISWCLIAGSKYVDWERSGLSGGVKLLSDLVFTPCMLLLGTKVEFGLVLDFPKQQSNVRHIPRSFFNRT